MGEREMVVTWQKMLAMLQSGLDVRKVITHRLDARDVLTGFEMMTSGRCGKMTLDWIQKLPVPNAFDAAA